MPLLSSPFPRHEFGIPTNNGYIENALIQVSQKTQTPDLGPLSHLNLSGLVVQISPAYSYPLAFAQVGLFPVLFLLLFLKQLPPTPHATSSRHVTSVPSYRTPSLNTHAISDHRTSPLQLMSLLYLLPLGYLTVSEMIRLLICVFRLDFP